MPTKKYQIELTNTETGEVSWFMDPRDDSYQRAWQTYNRIDAVILNCHLNNIDSVKSGRFTTKIVEIDLL